MHCVITGFDAFDSADINPSQLAVERINDELFALVSMPPNVQRVTHTLATCCSEAWSAVETRVKAIPQAEQFAVVMAGLARNRNRVCLERFALNVRSYRIADNRGHQWQEEFIDENAPDALRSNLPLFELIDHLNGVGIMTDISNYAGSFVCNETYFRALQKWRQEPRCMGILFVHFPHPVDYVGSNPDAKVLENVEQIEHISEKSVREYSRALAEIVKFIAVKSATSTVAGA